MTGFIIPAAVSNINGMNDEFSGDSREVSSGQPWLHPRLATTVAKHLAHPSRKPIAGHNRLAFAAIENVLASKRPLVLDSFCGTGQSTATLAARHPEHWVIGIDQSAHRLQKHVAGEPDNYQLLQAECEDIWHLLLEAGATVDYHYLLYPNPWPKPGHLGRRIHGHSSFRELLALGGRIELRSNWQIYVEEFGQAMHLAGHRGVIAQFEVGEPLTLFERKYHLSGQALWRFRARVQAGVQ